MREIYALPFTVSHRAEIRYGPAGWAYKDWDGIVFPKPKPKGFDPLEYLSHWFDTIEINSTFYRPASRPVARSWAERVQGNPRFRFTTKLGRRFTHERASPWTKADVKAAREGLDVLKDREVLGAVLLQFPWSFRRTDENRTWLRDLVDAFSDLPLVLEVRHESWNTPELYEGLAERGIGFVNIDQPLFRNSIKPSARVTASVAYVRVHGRNYREWFRKAAGPTERYDYLYSTQELKPWAERVSDLAESPETREVYVVTNNHFRGKAPANALMLKSLVEDRKVESPALLFDAYAEALAPHAWTRRPVERPYAADESLRM